MVLYEGTAFVAGKVRFTNLDSDTPVRIGDVPILDNTLDAQGNAMLFMGYLLDAIFRIADRWTVFRDGQRDRG